MCVYPQKNTGTNILLFYIFALKNKNNQNIDAKNYILNNIQKLFFIIPYVFITIELKYIRLK